jgi:RNA polymerase sigma-70 factor (ECF subfamily)
MPIPIQAEVIREAFRYQSALTSYAYGMLRDWALAKDAVQDAFVVLVEKYAAKEAVSPVFPLMKRIVRFKALELLRSRRREVPLADEELAQMVGTALDEGVSEAEAAQHNARVAALHSCIRQLSAPWRELLVGFYWRRQSCETLALLLGRPAPSLRVALMRIRGKLQDCMKRRLAEAEGLP